MWRGNDPSPRCEIHRHPRPVIPGELRSRRARVRFTSQHQFALILYFFQFPFPPPLPAHFAGGRQFPFAFGEDVFGASFKLVFGCDVVDSADATAPTGASDANSVLVRDKNYTRRGMTNQQALGGGGQARVVHQRPPHPEHSVSQQADLWWRFCERGQQLQHPGIVRSFRPEFGLRAGGGVHAGLRGRGVQPVLLRCLQDRCPLRPPRL